MRFLARLESWLSRHLVFVLGLIALAAVGAVVYGFAVQGPPRETPTARTARLELERKLFGTGGETNADGQPTETQLTQEAGDRR